MVCYIILETEVIAAEHNYAEIVVLPTAIDQGYTLHKCSRCEEAYKDNYVSALECTWDYKINDNGTTCTITGFKSSTQTDIVIPEEIDGFSVTSIGNVAFYLCNLTSIVIPDNVTSIGSQAFSDSDSLISVTFGENSQLTTISSYAFSDCDSLISVTFGENSQLATVGEHAFWDCEGLRSIVIPDSVTSIGSSAFSDCSSLTSIVIPDSVTTIGNDAFYNCGSLTSVTIGDSVTTIDEYTFYNCTSLTSVTIGDSVTTIVDYAFNSCSSLTSIAIPNSVTSIGCGAFFSCSSLTSIMIPFVGATKDGTSNTHFGYIFGARSLDYYFIPSSLKEVIVTGGATIDSYAFSDCSSLTSITIPDSVTTIGSYAFYGCTNLTDVYYAGTEEQWDAIDIDNTESCNSSLINATIHFLGETNENPVLINGTWGSLTWTLNETTGELIISGTGKMNGFFVVLGSSAWGNYSGLIKSVTIDNGVTTIGDFAFAYCDRLTSIEIPASVTTIGDLVFGGCISLTSINVDADNTAYKSIEGNLHSKDGKTLVQYAIGKTDTAFAIPDSVTTIGDYAFFGCDSLTSVTFGENSQLTTIGAAAFAACTSLTSIVIPSSVTTISSLYTSLGLDAFSSCYALAEVYNYSSLNITKGSSSYGHVAYYALDVYTTSEQSKLSTDENGFVIHTDGNVKTLVRYIGAASEITIPNSITAIGVGAFYNCDSLTSVVIPDSVTAIGDDAFYNCYALAEVYNYSSLNITKGSSSYGYVAYYALDVYTTNAPSNLTNDNGLIIHSDGTLVCYVGTDTEIAIPSSVTTIGAHAFTGCTNLTNVTFGEDSQLTTIGEYAFYGCSSLTSVTFGENSQLTTIGDYAFSGCYNLTSMDIPDGVTTIGDYAFEDCTSLTSVTIGNSVTAIGSNAFYNCSSLKDVYYIGTIEDWCGITFSSSSSNPMYYGTNLHVNGELLTGGLVIANTITEIKAAAFYGCTGLTSITIPDSVTTIGSNAFYNCSSLTSVTFGENSQLTTIGSNAFYGCTGLTSIVIPDSVTTIGSYAFEDCTSLTSVTFGENSQLTNIGNKAFEGCSSLKYNTHDNSKYLGNETNPYLVLIECISGEINESCKIIGGSAFALISFMLMDIIIPDSVTTISTDAFYGCSRLTNVTFGDNSQLTTIGDYAFDGCSSLTSIAIPDSVTSIGEAAFAFCESLTSVIIGNNATTIGDEAFACCESLISVTFGENSQLITIGDCAFDGCSSLTSIVIPDSVKIIGRGAFSDCDSLTSVYYGGSESEWENITIDSYNAELTNATRYYYRETEPTTSGNYWHYVDGVPTKW